MDVKIFHSIDDIDCVLWDSVVPDDMILKTHRFLKAVEHSNINDCRFWYVIFSENDKIIANAALFSMSFCLDVIAPIFIKNFCISIRQIAPDFLKLKLLGCGTPVATCTNGISVIDYVYFEKVIESLAHILFRIARQENIHCILFKEYNQRETEALDGLLSMGFIKVSSLPTSFIDIRWSSFDEYIRSLRKKYRSFVKKDLKKLNDPRITVEVCDDFGNYTEDLWNLYMNVYKKAEVKFEQLTPRFFKNVNMYLKDESRVIFIKSDGRIIAFELIIEDKSVLRPLYLGMDYGMNESFSLYFNNIYQIIKYGIEKNKSTIELGQTSYYPKLKVGARVEPLYLYLKFRNSLLQYLLRYPLKMLFPARGYAAKNIFKRTINN